MQRIRYQASLFGGQSELLHFTLAPDTRAATILFNLPSQEHPRPSSTLRQPSFLLTSTSRRMSQMDCSVQLAVPFWNTIYYVLSLVFGPGSTPNLLNLLVPLCDWLSSTIDTFAIWISRTHKDKLSSPTVQYAMLCRTSPRSGFPYSAQASRSPSSCATDRTSLRSATPAFPACR